MENKKRGILSFFSLKNIFLFAMIFFVVTTLIGYLFDRKDYVDFTSYLRDNFLSYIIRAVIVSLIFSYVYARQRKKEHESK